ncbi:MAG: LysR family transcriptional regulator [Marinobacterium sp.]|nr:LysR family transcriptional regulator [Marinobacterium sp.]
MNGSTFNQLKVFQAIVRAGSIRGAPRKLEMAAPSVSQALKQLESGLDLPLFTRSTRRIELTEAGQMPIALIVNDTDAMVDAAEKGLGIGRIVTPMIRQQLTEGRLQPILESWWIPYPGLYLYFVQNSQKARRVRVLIDFLIEKGQPDAAIRSLSFKR